MENNEVTPLEKQIPEQDTQIIKKKTSYMWIIVFLFFIIVVIVAGFVFMRGNKSSNSTTQRQITTTMKETDMSPSLPNNQKTAVIIMHSDSSMEKIIMANTLLENYVKSLSLDDKVVSETPLR